MAPIHRGVALATRRKGSHSGTDRGVQPEGHQSPDHNTLKSFLQNPQKLHLQFLTCEVLIIESHHQDAG
jgi:hypothetical protein